MAGLPEFKPTKYQQIWIQNELTTAKWIRTLWLATAKAERKNAVFLALLARASWINSSGENQEGGRLMRNMSLARWLGVSPRSEQELRLALTSRLGVSPAKARWLVKTESGITHYYKAIRPRFVKHLAKHSTAVHQALEIVAAPSTDVQAKVRRVASMVAALPSFKDAKGGTTHLMNGLSPLLACLDPQRRFPIMNDKTKSLLRAFGKGQDAQGAAELTRLIGKLGIRHSFDLDVYAASSTKFPKVATATSGLVKVPQAVGLKSEQAAFAVLAKRRVTIRKLHNALINRLKEALDWKVQIVESEYDALVNGWRKGRWLLIEAKPSVSGPGGRTQLRQAIGQLFDYRWRFFKNAEKVDLALLTTAKPEKDVLALLGVLGIEALWFEGKTLTGTIDF